MTKYHLVARYLARLTALDRFLYAKRLPPPDRNLLAADLLRAGVSYPSVRFMLSLCR